MRLLSFLLGLLLALPAAAIDIGAMPNPSYYNPLWGAAMRDGVAHGSPTLAAQLRHALEAAG